jgi:hypothetical protein
MKKYLKMLPVIIYPYVYLIAMALYFWGWDFSAVIRDYGLDAVLIMAIVYNLYSLIAVIVNIVSACKGKRSAKELAKMNLIIKTVQIPAYIFHFILGLVGIVASIWGIGFIMWAVFIDTITIFLTGLNAVSVSVRCCKENILSKQSSVIFAVLSFVYCIDVLIAVVFFAMARKRD